ncbi:MAG: DUF726 domain-containing protein [Candidatus Wallbacteria bacterium]
MNNKNAVIYVHGYGGNGSESPVLKKLASVLNPEKQILIPFLWNSGNINSSVISDISQIMKNFASDTIERSTVSLIEKILKSDTKSDFTLSQARSCILGRSLEKYLKQNINNINDISIISFSLGTRIVHDFLKICNDGELLAKINKVIMLAPAMPEDSKAELKHIRKVKPGFLIEAYYSPDFDLALKVVYSMAGNASRAAGEVGFSNSELYKNIKVNFCHSEYDKVIDYLNI